MSVEEAWKEWASSESGVGCLDPALLAATIELDRHLKYRLRAAFVAGWIAKERSPVQMTKEVDSEQLRKLADEEEERREEIRTLERRATKEGADNE